MTGLAGYVTDGHVTDVYMARSRDWLLPLAALQRRRRVRASGRA